jgi:thioredoxin reductase (NADPH)
MKIVLYSSTGCQYCAKIKNELKTWGYDYEERNVTENQEYFNDLHDKGIFSVPVTFLDETPVIGYRPNQMKKLLGVTEEQIAKATAPTEAQGLENEKESMEDLFSSVSAETLSTVYDLVCIGSGPAGASAAVYASRGKLKTLVIDKAPASGALAITHKIANYPGVYEELTGIELVDRIRKQAKDFGATFVRSSVQTVNFTGEEYKEIHLPEGTVKAKTVFVAVGARGRTSKIAGEEEFAGRGVSYCSTCDAAFFAGKTVAVVGDNEEAVSEASTLSKFAEKVLFLIPGKRLFGSADIHDLDGHGNITVLWQHRVKKIEGDTRLEGITVQKGDGGEAFFPVHGVFLYVSGNKPATEFLEDALVKDEEGYIRVNELMETSVEGVFAGGDARRTPLKQAVIAAADGAIVALGADKFVNQRNKLIPQYS